MASLFNSHQTGLVFLSVHGLAHAATDSLVDDGCSSVEPSSLWLWCLIFGVATMLSVSTCLGARLWVRLFSNNKLEPPHFHSLLIPNPKCLLKRHQLKGTLCPQHRLSLTQTPLVFHCLKLKLLNSTFEIWAPSCPSMLPLAYGKMAWLGSSFWVLVSCLKSSLWIS